MYGNRGAAQADIQQGHLKPFVGMFELNGSAGLLAVIALLLSAQRANNGFTLVLAIALELAQQRAAGNSQRVGCLALVSATTFQGVKHNLFFQLVKVAV